MSSPYQDKFCSIPAISLLFQVGRWLGGCSPWNSMSDTDIINNDVIQIEFNCHNPLISAIYKLIGSILFHVLYYPVQWEKISGQHLTEMPIELIFKFSLKASFNDLIRYLNLLLIMSTHLCNILYQTCY